MSPSKERSYLRSITYMGIAQAMAEQWGRTNPTLKGIMVCFHVFEYFFVHDIKFRGCKYCDLLERQDLISGYEIWTKVIIKPSIA